MPDSVNHLDAPDRGQRLAHDPSMAELGKSIRTLRSWLIVLSALLALTVITALVAIAAVVYAAWGLAASDMIRGPFGDGEVAVPQGPPLSNVASLPVNAAGEGTIKGTPTGEASSHETRGTFVLVLEPAPGGLPSRTTLHVAIDHSTKVYRDGHEIGDALTAMNSMGGPHDADPSAAGTVVVRFHVKDGRVFADRLDLSDDYPPGMEW